MSDFKSQDITKRLDLIFKPQDVYLKSTLNSFKPVPPGSSPPNPALGTLNKDTLFQIVSIRDINKSCINYIESLTELIDINEGFYDRQQKQNRSAQPPQRVIRSANVDHDGENGEDGGRIVGSGGGKKMYKLTLQDSYCNLTFAYEIEDLEFLRNSGSNPLYPVKLGSKLLIKKGCSIILDSCFQLENRFCLFLSGEIDKLNFKLFENQLGLYKSEIGY